VGRAEEVTVRREAERKTTRRFARARSLGTCRTHLNREFQPWVSLIKMCVSRTLDAGLKSVT